MPVQVQDIISRPRVSPLRVAIEPVYNALESLWVLTQVDELSGLAGWVYHTAQDLSAEQRRQHRLVMIGLHYAIIPQHSWPSFPEYLSRLASAQPQALVDRLMNAYVELSCEGCDGPVEPDRREEEIHKALSGEQAYLEFLYRRFQTDCIDEALEAEAYSYVNDPPALQRLVVSHLQKLWDRYMEAEWKQTRPMLERTVSALQKLDLDGMERMQALGRLTGQDLSGGKWEKKLAASERIIAVPNPHLGPYLGHFRSGENHLLLFGARLPSELSAGAPELNRYEILIRINALDDETRLSILELIGRNGEQRSQEVMQALELSQSAASRHLKHLTATGYLSERWKEGAKSYTLNLDRLEDTLQAIRAFVLGK